MSHPTYEANWARISAEITNRRHEQQVCAWLVISEIGDVLLTNQQSTGWIDVPALIKTANRTGIQWSTGYCDHDRMVWLLRVGFGKSCSLQIDNTAIEMVDVEAGQQSTPMLRFTRVALPSFTSTTDQRGNDELTRQTQQP